MVAAAYACSSARCSQSASSGCTTLGRNDDSGRNGEVVCWSIRRERPQAAYHAADPSLHRRRLPAGQCHCLLVRRRRLQLQLRARMAATSYLRAMRVADQYEVALVNRRRQDWLDQHQVAVPDALIVQMVAVHYQQKRTCATRDAAIEHETLFARSVAPFVEERNRDRVARHIDAVQT